MSNRENERIRSAIQQIALQGLGNLRSGTIRGSERITGYVAKIHDDEKDELYGTVDVQEFDTPSFIQENNGVKYGYHEGVYLSALQKNNEGYLIVPKLYSEVTIAMDPKSHTEYVVMFSHVDLLQLDSHEKIRVGVREREPFDDNEDGDDINELKLTGVASNIEFAKDSITHSVIADKDAKNTATLVMDGEGIRQTAGDDKSSQTITQDKISLEHDKSSVTLDNSQAQIKEGSSAVIVEDGTVHVGTKGATDDAVLGQQLASILSELVGYLGQMMTPTMMGPQPPANVLASFIALKTKIQTFASSHSGFLTKKVQIQK